VAGKDPQVETCAWKRLDSGDPWGEAPASDPPDWAFRVVDDPELRLQYAQAGWPTSVFDRDRTYRPTEAKPLIYHLFGHHRRPRSLVLTEDDYFDFLIGVTRDKDLVPVGVRRAFADSSSARWRLYSTVPRLSLDGEQFAAASSPACS